MPRATLKESCEGCFHSEVVDFTWPTMSDLRKRVVAEASLAHARGGEKRLKTMRSRLSKKAASASEAKHTSKSHNRQSGTLLTVLLSTSWKQHCTSSHVS